MKPLGGMGAEAFELEPECEVAVLFRGEAATLKGRGGSLVLSAEATKDLHQLLMSRTESSKAAPAPAVVVEPEAPGEASAAPPAEEAAPAPEKKGLFGKRK